ncbi:hypothetical protein DYBT9275_05629 [Dyadobacter sp. CECT 9275]|uniref:Uncharacterized protein n=1 Tax=Dyadobacter helix TaxID=2822344 RepID=A0A916NEI2_9BACT|nr:hypothetical protein [Dyadobacter sp. CECT 9275]CAG5016756.1 hypothetical protein DYBT9275_05629 [Dyadobacter sp. CECT 9275]
MFKKRNLISRLWLKHTDRVRYKEYKWELKNQKQLAFAHFITQAEKLTSPAKIKSYAEKNGVIRLSHSGNAGDIIYALPTIEAIKQYTNARIELYLRLGQPLILSGYNSHPLGNVMLNEKMATMLIALLKPQPYIDHIEIHDKQIIDIDLDYFRAGGIPLDKGNIARWCSYLTGVNPVLWKPWLTVEPDTTYADTIVMARSERYRNYTINYKFLIQYPDIAFIGVESEFKDIRKTIPGIRWIQVSDFMQMARIIAGAKFFIGNQSFPYSVAEGLKVPRILETAFEVINVVPEGDNGYDFFFQEHLESLVYNLNNKS